MNDAKALPAGSSKELIRAFVCIEIPATIKARIEDLQRALKQPAAQISWVKSANIHLTIKFLGNVATSRIETIRRAVERAAQSVNAFAIEVSGAGCFPNARAPRVLWVGLGQIPEALSQLHTRIENELAREGFARAPKRFAPHLTIGRARTPNQARATAEALIARGLAPETFQAREIIVMRSDLNPAGSIYTPQAVIHLD